PDTARCCFIRLVCVRTIIKLNVLARSWRGSLGVWSWTSGLRNDSGWREHYHHHHLDACSWYDDVAYADLYLELPDYRYSDPDGVPTTCFGTLWFGTGPSVRWSHL